MVWIFYALIALFFGYLLFDAFGKPVGRTKPDPRRSRRHDGPPKGARHSDAEEDGAYEPYSYTGSAPDQGGIGLNENQVAPGADRGLIESGLQDIYDADERFDLDRFFAGSKRTLELMLEAFQARDREQLEVLLKPDLYEAFHKAITAAEEAEDNSKLELVSLGDPRLVEAKMEDTLAVVRLTTQLEQLVAKRDPDGGDVDGLGETVRETAEYTFVRDVNSTAPNWYLRSIEEA